MRTWIARKTPWLLVVGLVVTALALHIHTVFAAGSPEQAVATSVLADGSRYAGDCAQAVLPRDLGAVCSRLVERRGGIHAYLVGRTFGEFSDWIFVAQTVNGWQPVGDAPLRFNSGAGEIPWP